MKLIFSALALAAACVAAPGQAADRMIGDWKLVDHGETCALSRAAADGAIGYIMDGVTADDGIGFTSPRFKGVESRKSYKISIGLGGKATGFTAEGFDDGGPARGFIVFDYPIAELAAREHSGDLIFKWKGRVVHRLPMAGLVPAMQALATCSADGKRRRGI